MNITKLNHQVFSVDIIVYSNLCLKSKFFYLALDCIKNVSNLYTKIKFLRLFFPIFMSTDCFNLMSMFVYFFSLFWTLLQICQTLLKNKVPSNTCKYLFPITWVKTLPVFFLKQSNLSVSCVVKYTYNNNYDNKIIYVYKTTHK